MKRITDITGAELVWQQLSAFKREYVLLADEVPAATLKFDNAFSTLATGQSADGCWVFKRMGFWQVQTTIRECSSQTEVGVFRKNVWKGGGELQLPFGQIYQARTNFWQTEYALQTETGMLIFQARIGGVFHLSIALQIESTAVRLPYLPWLVLLGAYQIIMMRNDAAAAAA